MSLIIQKEKDTCGNFLIIFSCLKQRPGNFLGKSQEYFSITK